MIPLEQLPVLYQRKYAESGMQRMRELREFHLHDARFCELQRTEVKHAAADASAYNKIAQKLGYNIRVISSANRVFAYKTDDESAK